MARNIDLLRLKSIIIALLVYLPTVVYFPLWIHLLLIFFVFPKRDFKPDISFFIILLIFILSFINQRLNFTDALIESPNFKNYFPTSFFILVSYFFARVVNNKSLKYIIYFISFEALIGILEYSLGVRSIIPGVSDRGETYFGYKDLMYYTRVMGLSGTGSTFAFKIFLGILLFYYIRDEIKLNYIFLIIIFAGLVVAFNRTVFLGVGLFLFIYYWREILSFVLQLFKFRISWKHIVLIAILISSIWLTIEYFDLLIHQFTRGRVFDYSRRDVIFESFYNFIIENPVFGNGSHKLWLSSGGYRFHAHNSFLEILATNGLLIALFYFLLIAINIRKTNYMYILPMLLISTFQYAIFWGISIQDLIFFTFLFNIYNISNEENIKQVDPLLS